MRVLALLVLSTCGLVAASLANADAGPLPDPIWGGPGGDSTAYIGTDILANVSDMATDSYLQPDGKLVMAGIASNPGAQGDIAVARLQAASGAPDPSFGGGDGRVELGLSNATHPHIARDFEGRMLFSAQVSESTAVLGRLTEDGTLDPDFDQDGKKFISTTTILDAATVFYTSPIILPQADGKYLAFATVFRPGPPIFLCAGVIRLNSNGSIDPTFAAGAGRACEAPPYTGLNAAYVLSIAATTAGDLLLAGAAYHAGGAAFDVSVVKLSAEGIRDSSFGTDGWAYVAFDEGGNLIDLADAIQVDALGRIVFGTTLQTDTNSRGAGLARILPNGQPDTSFGLGGKLILGLEPTTPDSQSGTLSLAILPDQQILAGGFEGTGSFLALVSGNGMPNPQFGTAGHFHSPKGTFESMNVTGDYAYSIGSATNPANNHESFAATRRIIPIFRSDFE